MNLGTRLAYCSLVLCCCLLPAEAQEASVWPQFRGPGARGVALGSGLPEVWSATENVAWKRDLPGRGWSSPVVWGGSVFLTTVVNTGESEEPKKGLYFGGDRTKPPQSVHQWRVV
ncbi:MAG: PQQ-binding-like beta-propeller repeat protein, partial [Planctomycetaceae bacterium]